ncbi:phytosulfokines 1-like [Raphanus sativus]|uniref:Phytosulfokine n=1 Tax=Raphanus sativus TaxID=3726 RepID=A0A6J0JUV7_RAPSA|nr:phytosulfokines 1-like [Raphanus sativus]
MMKRKSKVLIIFFTLVLLLSVALSVISREDGFAPLKQSPSSRTSSMHESRKGDGDGVECKNSDSEEECLVKKTVAAHTDYIYTQDMNISP